MSWRIDIVGILKCPQFIRSITLAWIVLVVAGSLQPNRLLLVVKSLQHASRPIMVIGSLQTTRAGPVVVLHREIHWLAFGGAEFLLLLGSRNRRQELRSVIGMVLLGLTLECMQHLIYHSPMEWYDVRDDALAILVAFALYRLAGTCQAACRARRTGTGRRAIATFPAAAGRNSISPDGLSSAANAPVGNPLDEAARS